MFGPIVLFLEETRESAADGQTARSYYAEVPFARLVRVITVQLGVRSIDANTTIAIKAQNSLDGVSWVDVGDSWSSVSAVGTTLYASSSALSERVRIVVSISGSTGSVAKQAVFVVLCGGKPF
jgi:hypothetical protein